MTRDKDINSDDQVAPDRVGSSAAEGGASAGGGFGVGLGVVDSRLPPHTKPPTHHSGPALAASASGHYKRVGGAAFLGSAQLCRARGGRFPRRVFEGACCRTSANCTSTEGLQRSPTVGPLM